MNPGNAARRLLALPSVCRTFATPSGPTMSRPSGGPFPRRSWTPHSAEPSHGSFGTLIYFHHEDLRNIIGMHRLDDFGDGIEFLHRGVYKQLELFVPAGRSLIPVVGIGFRKDRDVHGEGLVDQAYRDGLGDRFAPTGEHHKAWIGRGDSRFLPSLVGTTCPKGIHTLLPRFQP